MSFKDIAGTINEYTGEDKQANKPEKPKTLAFELYLQGKQSVEVAIELDIPAEKGELFDKSVNFSGVTNFE